MEYIILESNGVEISNVDGAAFNNFSASGQDGVLKGLYNECAVTLLNSETIQINTGELLIQGFRVKIFEPYTITIPSNLADINHYLVACIVLQNTGSVTFNIEVRQTSSLTKNNLFRAGYGTYEIEICRFVVGATGIVNLSKTIKVISSSIDSYSKKEIDNMFNSYVTELANLIGGEALA